MSDVAAFDFDGTLTNGGSVFGFLSAVAGERRVMTATAGLAPRLVHAAVVGGTTADTTKEQLFVRVLKGIPVDLVTAASVTFAHAHLDAHLRTDVHERLLWHRRRGDRIAIVSASPEAYVKVVGDRLGADQVIATRLETTVDGPASIEVLTGRYDGANCRGEEKLRRLHQWIETIGADGSQVWAYGNSRGDLRMLRAADVPVNVGRLGGFGALRTFGGLEGTGPGLHPA